MYTSTLPFAILAISAASLVAAAPAADYAALGPRSANKTYSTKAPFPTEVSQGSDFRYPLSNEFPTPNPDELTAIGVAAKGTLPNGPPPPSVQPDSLTSLQLIAFNELTEVAFFTELLQNVTNNVHGYEIPRGMDRRFLLESLKAIQAQEELHLLNANGALAHFGKAAIQPCAYSFPVTSFSSAIALAATFTDVVLGTLPDIQTVFATSKDNGLIRGVGAVIGQEGEQDGFFRLLQDKRPSAQPFLTASARAFAFSALVQNFVVPGSCPQPLSDIDLTVFEPLIVIGTPRAGDEILSFSFKPTSADNTLPAESLQLVYINGQNLPIVGELKNVNTLDGGVVQFEADFPQKSSLLDGLTIAAVTTKGNLTDVDAVAQNTLFGPGLIEVN